MASRATYRDTTTALREQIRALCAQIEERERRLTEAFWKHWPSESAAELKRIKADTETRGRGDDELIRRLAALRLYLDALELIIEAAPGVGRDLQKLPPDPPGLWVFEGPTTYAPTSLFELWAELKPILEGLGLSGAPTEQDSWYETHYWQTRFTHEQIPYSLLLQHTDRPPDHDSHPLLRNRERHPIPPGSALTIATSVARVAPALTVSPETYRHGLLKALRIVREHQVGDQTIDGTFLIRARDPDAVALLDDKAWQGLLKIAHDDVPTLEITPGIALLSWSSVPTHRAVHGALTALARIRLRSADIEPLVEAT